MKKIRPIISCILITGFAAPALAHESWLEAEKFQVQTGQSLKVSIRNGENFEGGMLGYFENRAVLFDWLQNAQRQPVTARSGDFPALGMVPADQGLMVLIYQAAPSVLQYKTWEKFAKFARHKGFENVKTRHLDRGLPDKMFGEVYSRFCKSLIGAGHAKGHDIDTGMETEFIAITNPYTDNLNNGFTVKLLFQGKPRMDAQIEVFERGADKTVAISTLRTDNQGRASIPVKAGHTYLLDAVVLREPSADLAAKHNVVWETLWASLTFKVPD